MTHELDFDSGRVILHRCDGKPAAIAPGVMPDIYTPDEIAACDEEFSRILLEGRRADARALGLSPETIAAQLGPEEK